MDTIQALLLFACLAWLSPPSSSECGIQAFRNSKIVGGKDSAFGKWPWHVSLSEVVDKVQYTETTYRCGGVLISETYVLSAAHCEVKSPSHMGATFGEYTKNAEQVLEPTRIIVRHFIAHPEYNNRTWEHDIAVLELRTPVTYDMHIVPICLPNEEDDFVDRMALVTGWGKLEEKGQMATILQEVKVPVISNEMCEDMFMKRGYEKIINEYFLCAGYTEGKKDACEGDSGGPLKVKDNSGRWTVIGVVSHGIGCAQPNLPGVYSRITYYMSWILSVMDE